METITKKIKSIVLTSTGSGSDYSNLQVKEEDYPKLDKDDHVIIRMKATGLNFSELMQRQGLYSPKLKTPYTPGYEGSGVVEEVGSAVTDFKVNDRVVVFSPSGIWKEVVMLPRTSLCLIPDEMPFEDAAGIVVNYVTAYQILFRMAGVKPGDSVLVHMAAGGVGTAATQLLKTISDVTIFGTASPAKHEAIRENGVNHPINYQHFAAEVKKVSPEGVDIVLDPLNGENSIIGYNLLKPLGKIVHYGAASMTSESRSLLSAFKTWYKCQSVNSIDIMSHNKMMGGYHLGLLASNPEFGKIVMSDIKTIIELYKQKKITIKIDSTYSFSNVGEAMKRMHARQNIGKIILKPDFELPPPATPEDVKVTTVSPATETTSGAVDQPAEVKPEAEVKTAPVAEAAPAPKVEAKVEEPAKVEEKPVKAEEKPAEDKPAEAKPEDASCEPNGSVPTA